MEDNNFSGWNFHWSVLGSPAYNHVVGRVRWLLRKGDSWVADLEGMRDLTGNHEDAWGFDKGIFDWLREEGLPDDYGLIPVTYLDQYCTWTDPKSDVGVSVTGVVAPFKHQGIYIDFL